MSVRGIIKQWQQQAQQLKVKIYALYLAYKDPRVPWYAKVFIALVVGYAFSPIDLIPDFVPIFGYVDDLILLPLGIILACKMIPQPVWDECQENAQLLLGQGKPQNWIAAGIIVLIWLFLIGTSVVFVAQILSEMSLS